MVEEPHSILVYRVPYYLLPLRVSREHVSVTAYLTKRAFDYQVPERLVLSSSTVVHTDTAFSSLPDEVQDFLLVFPVMEPVRKLDFFRQFRFGLVPENDFDSGIVVGFYFGLVGLAVVVL